MATITQDVPREGRDGPRELEEFCRQVKAVVNAMAGPAGSGDLASLRAVVSELLAATATSLAGLLSNTGPNFPFANLPDATPSVVEALNTLNAQIGDRTYSGTGPLTSGQTIAASLQALNGMFSSSGAVDLSKYLLDVSGAFVYIGDGDILLRA